MGISFRRLDRADLGMLAVWLSRPHVQEWWREEHDPGEVDKRYGPCIDRSDPTEVFIAEIDGRPVGLVQRYLLDDEPGWARSLAPSGPHHNAAGIDYLLGDEALTGHGLGSAMIAAFVEFTWSCCPPVAEIVTSVAQGNCRSWRALEKAGFVRTWVGDIDSDDPSDDGPSYVYTLDRPRPAS